MEISQDSAEFPSSPELTSVLPNRGLVRAELLRKCMARAVVN